MLTVKIVESLNFSETVFEARQVRKALNEDRKKGDLIIGNVYIEPVDIGVGEITYPIMSPDTPDSERTIYVMNRYGATVASYQL